MCSARGMAGGAGLANVCMQPWKGISSGWMYGRRSAEKLHRCVSKGARDSLEETRRARRWWEGLMGLVSLCSHVQGRESRVGCLLCCWGSSCTQIHHPRLGTFDELAAWANPTVWNRKRVRDREKAMAGLRVSVSCAGAGISLLLQVLG